ncbi:SDR family NAD(P)-dependent oxidoreductase [Streptomyces wedmorensis]|uniref:SDR family NAD(P)-dependent oxidoreductase n=1 Tax=Streptomyces wedmorensis TaxID=43759 RepID=UPI0037A05B71
MATRPTPSPSGAPIAIVGAGALIPGAQDLDGFWRVVTTGQDMITDVPPGHWLVEDYYDSDPAAPDKTYGRRGAFLSPVEFDPLAFGIPPNDLPATDTTQLLSLLVAEQVLHDALQGRRDPIDRDRVSVILGTAPLDLLATMGNRMQRPVWLKALRENGVPESEAQQICDRIAGHYVPWQEATFPGLLSNVVAGRIANRFDLHGANYTTDAACASSLAAISSAVSELQLGKADMVLTGGVDTLNDILMYMCFSKTPALSPSGDCRPFSAEADGTILGEGLVMFALRRLEDAERDGDRIYAVVRGIGSSSDGRSTAIYAPLPAGQERALRRAYEAAGFGPETVELVEAHGTGTSAGDKAELTALRSVFDSAGREDRQWCALGSIKSQIGHTKSAAGAAGLLKAALALHHKVLPPTIKVDRPNPALSLTESPFYLNTEARPWLSTGAHPRRASVSSFGFGGSNFHIALEEHVPKNDVHRTDELPLFDFATAELFLLSEDSPAALGDRADALAPTAGEFSDRARESRHSFRPDAPWRLALVAAGPDDLVTKAGLAARALRDGSGRGFSLPNGVHCVTGAPAPGRIAFLFSGQGTQYVGMGRDLAVQSAVARQAWLDTDRFEPERGGVSRLVFPPSASGEEARQAQATALTATDVAQPALAAVSLAQLTLMERFGLRPDCAGGHSFGELVALHTAGALDARTLMGLARERGRLMRDAVPGGGAMLAVHGVPSAVQDCIDTADDAVAQRVWISAFNGPEQVVVSGHEDAVCAVEGLLSGRGLNTQRLRTSSAFHTPLMEPARAGMREFLSTAEIEPPLIDVFGNADGAVYPDDPEAVRARIADHLVAPVQYLRQIEAMYEAGVRTFVEFGAGTTSTALVRRVLGDREHLALSLDRPGADGVATFLEALGLLAVRGVELGLGALDGTEEGVGMNANVDGEASQAQNGPAGNRPRLTKTISGTNFAKPYPPAGGAAALPPPNPEHALTRPLVPEGPAPATPPEPVTRPVVGAPTVAAGWLEAFQESQRQTAETQIAFQRALAESHEAYLSLAENSMAHLAALLSGTAPQTVQAEPTAIEPSAGGATPRRTPPRPLAAAPPSLAVATATPLPCFPVVPPPAEPDPAPAPEQSSAVDLRELLLAVVAEKTGYPAEMLRPEMDLESDLGIDSIKRVQILSVMRERVPGLAEFGVADMTLMRTLGAIGEAMAGTGAPDTVPPPAEPDPAPAPEQSSAVDLRELLLAVVAEKTGYPAEMLRPEMDLESDLGIDSIKRVQILSVMRERVPGLAEFGVADMTLMRTLGAIGEAMAGTGAPDTDPPAAGAPSVTPEEADRAEKAAHSERSASASAEATGADGGRPVVLTRSVITTLAARAPGLRLGGLGGGPVVVTDDGGGIAQQTVSALAGLGIDARVTDHVPEDEPVHGVVFLGGLRAVSSAEDAIAINREAFEAARTFARRPVSGSAPDAGGFFVTVQDTGGDFGLSGADPVRPWLGGISALARTAALEWDSVAVKAIDCRRGDRSPRDIASALVHELLTGGPQTDVGLKADGTRLILTLHETPQAPTPPPAAVAQAPVSDRSVIVVTGGARGITAGVLRALVGQCRPRIALLGRSPMPEEQEDAGLPDTRDESVLQRAVIDRQIRRTGRTPAPAEARAEVRRVLAAREIKNTLTALSEAGAEVGYLSCDINDPGALASALKVVRGDWGPITGLVHGAGVLADRLIADKTDTQFDQVFDTKAGALLTLLDATREDPLTLICLFSSVAARHGNRGQSDYAMANEVLNQVACAEQASRPDCLVRAIGWGPWEGGMVTPELAEHFRRSSVPLIPLPAGADAFTAELTTRDTPVVVVEASHPGSVRLGGPTPSMLAEVLLDHDTFPQLADHQVADDPVLPMALVADWFAALALLRAPGAATPRPGPVALEDLSVRRTVVLDRLAAGGNRFLIRAEDGPDGGHVELLDERGTSLYHARTTVPAPPEGATPVLVPTGGAEGPPPAYGTGSVLFHGPAFQALVSAHHVTADGARATVRGSAALGWPERPWVTDPGAVDGGLQLALLWAEQALGDATLPMSVKRVRLLREGLLDGPGTCEVRPVTVGDAIAECDVIVHGTDGEPRVELTGLSLVQRPSPMVPADLPAGRA